MNITVTLTANPELLAVLSGLVKAFTPQGKDVSSVHVNGNGTLVDPTDNGTAPAPATGATKKAGKAETPAPDATTETKVVTLEQVRVVVNKQIQAGKKEKVKALIAEFGGSKVTDLQQDQYADFLTKVEAL